MFDGVIAQTTLAHRLLLKAWNLGGQRLQLPLVNTLFKDYFSDGLNVADESILAKAAADHGVMSESEVRPSLSFVPRRHIDRFPLQTLEFLRSDECLKEVEQMMIDVRKKGVTGVPFVVIDSKWAVSGGQSAETYVQVRV